MFFLWSPSCGSTSIPISSTYISHFYAFVVEEVDAGKRAPLRSVAMVKKDILSSEETYVYCLSLIVDGYLAELEGNPHKPDFIIERKANIFGNVSEVYNLHKKLLDVLRKETGTEEMCKGFLQLVSSSLVDESY